MNQKQLRYYYWIFTAFTKKHLKLIMLSFFISVVAIVSVISLSPFIVNSVTNKTQLVGVVGSYDFNHVPDQILSKVSNGLVFINEKGQIVPIIAERWELTNNGKEYRFHIRKNLLWNDDKPFTAHEIQYKFKDIETQVIDDYTIHFVLKKPLPIFPSYLTAPIIKYPLVGVAGLYKVQHFKTQQGLMKEITLQPNKSDLPVIVYKFYDSETKMIDAYKLGEVNQMEISRKEVADQFKDWKNTEVKQSVDYSHLLTLFLNMNNPFFKDDKDARQAVSMAIDRKKLQDQGEEAIGPIPPISWAYNNYLKKDTYEPDLAAKILRKVGDASSSASLNLNTSYDYLDVSTKIKEDLEAAGLKVNVQLDPLNSTNDFDMLLGYWKVPLDPDQYYFWHSTQKQGNITNYKNEKIDLLLEQGRNSISLDERKRIYDNFQRTILDDTPAVFLYYPFTYTISRK